MNSEDFSNWVTGYALILATAGAAWKWIFAEMLRRMTDFPSLEGTIAAVMTHSETDFTEVIVKAVWTNPTKRKIYLNTQESQIYVYDITQQFPSAGPVDLGAKDTCFAYSSAPYAHSDFVFYEPGTSSEFTANFRLPCNTVYAARAFLVMDELKMKKKNVWFRDILFDTSQRNQSTVSVHNA